MASMDRLSMLEDQALAEAIGQGDKNAEAELYQRFARPVITLLRQRSGDRYLAEDLMQDTFSILIDKLRNSALEDASRLAGYVHRTALNVWRGYARKEIGRKTQPDTDTVESVSSESYTQLESLLNQEEADAVRALLSEMRNARDREILNRTYLLEQDKPLVCDELNLTEAHFDRVIYRAKQRFRAVVEARLGSSLAEISGGSRE